jgi:hypothetical protein
LRALIEGNHVYSFHLETLECNSPAAKALPHAPNYAILGVEDCNGKSHTDIPVEWQTLRYRLLLFGAALVVSAIAILIEERSAWLSLLAATLLAIPRRPPKLLHLRPGENPPPLML